MRGKLFISLFVVAFLCFGLDGMESENKAELGVQG